MTGQSMQLFHGLGIHRKFWLIRESSHENVLQGLKRKTRSLVKGPRRDINDKFDDSLLQDWVLDC
jgi:hypothetical protein